MTHCPGIPHNPLPRRETVLELHDPKIFSHAPSDNSDGPVTRTGNVRPSPYQTNAGQATTPSGTNASVSSNACTIQRLARAPQDPLPCCGVDWGFGFSLRVHIRHFPPRSAGGARSFAECGYGRSCSIASRNSSISCGSTPNAVSYQPHNGKTGEPGPALDVVHVSSRTPISRPGPAD